MIKSQQSKGGHVNIQGSFFGSRNIVWFSCGVASATTAKLAIEKYGAGNVNVVYCDMRKDEHPDNDRFLLDVQSWIGQQIEIIGNPKFSSIDDVFDGATYMSGVGGAECTVQMKKIPRFNYQFPDDLHMLGLCADEKRRIDRFSEANFDMRLDWILLDRGMTKEDCKRFVADAGIELPAMYELGFANNNCIGCVKATSPKYWNMIRAHFPESFKRRAAQSRRIGCKLVRLHGERIYLDELPATENEVVVEDISCGIQCGGRPTDM